jgi:hypothetical protein
VVALLRLMTLRAFVALGGIASLAVGLVLAWRTGAASTALIVGAVLLGIAVLLAPGWESVSVSGAGWQLFVRRAEEAKQTIAEAAASEGVSPEVKRKLETAGEQLETAETLTRASGSPVRPAADRLVRQLTDLMAARRERGGSFILVPRHAVESGAVKLSLD